MNKPRKNNTKAVVEKMIRESEVAVSHSDIMAELGKTRNRVTIYRALDRLVEEGVIHRIVNIDGVSKFAACQTCGDKHHYHNHIHFSCTECNEVTCLDDVEPSFNLPSGYSVNEVNFTISGVCNKCPQ
ncbi:MAG: transcriptional repressor [Bacteroidota bacterium]